MEKKWAFPEQKLSDSVFFRLFTVFWGILIPVSILLIAYAIFSLFSAMDWIYAEKENILRGYGSQLDTALDEVSTRLYRLSLDSHMLILQKSGPKGAEDDIEWYGARSYVYNQYFACLQDYPLMGGLYSCIAYGPGEREYVICTSFNHANRNDEIIGYLDGILGTAEEEDGYVGVQWEEVELQGQVYFLLLRKHGNCYYGGWFQTDEVFEYWGIREEEYVFLNQEGQIAGQAGKGDLGDSREAEGALNVERGRNVVVVDSDVGAFSIAQFLDRKNTWANIPAIVVALVLLTVLAISSVPVLAMVIRKYIFRPVNQLLIGMKQVETGELDYQIAGEEEHKGEFAVLTSHFNKMVTEIHDLKIETYEKELEKQRIKLQYLSQQIQPHFILNTLNILHCYGEDEFPLIQEMLLCLSRYFRYVVKVNVDFVELGQELAHIRNYLEIQKTRYPDFFDFSVQLVEGVERVAIPPLLIQNFTENAVKYSVSMNYEVRIDVKAERMDAQTIRIRSQIQERGFRKMYWRRCGSFSGLVRTRSVWGLEFGMRSSAWRSCTMAKRGLIFTIGRKAEQ